MHFTRLIGNKQGKFKQGIKLWHIPSFIFLTDSTHQDEAKKFGSLNLDTPRITYEFYKLATNSLKE